MEEKQQILIDVLDNTEVIGKYRVDYDKLANGLYALGYRKLTDSEIKILEMLENDTDINEIEKFRQEQL